MMHDLWLRELINHVYYLKIFMITILIMTIRQNSKGIVYTDEAEYLKAFEKSWGDETKRISLQEQKRRRGRPAKNKQKGLSITQGEYLITFD